MAALTFFLSDDLRAVLAARAAGRGLSPEGELLAVFEGAVGVPTDEEIVERLRNLPPWPTAHVIVPPCESE